VFPGGSPSCGGQGPKCARQTCYFNRLELKLAAYFREARITDPRSVF
jgi:hypothetical protein